MEMIYMLRGLVSKDVRLFGLIEGSAQEAHRAIEGLAALLEAPADQLSRSGTRMKNSAKSRARLTT
jgi:hypothetical protein